MGKILELREYRIEEVLTEMEINYVISDEKGYVCRLVPGADGFEPSPHDKALGNEPDAALLNELGDFIISQHE